MRDVLLHVPVRVLPKQEPVRRVRELAQLVHLLYALPGVPEPELLLRLHDAACALEHLAEPFGGGARICGVKGDLLDRAAELGHEAAKEDGSDLVVPICVSVYRSSIRREARARGRRGAHLDVPRRVQLATQSFREPIERCFHRT